MHGQCLHRCVVFDSLSLSSCVLQDESPLTAIAFSSGGDGLIVANASNHVGVYHVESMAATDWTRTVGARLPGRLLDMPGSIASIAVHPKVRPALPQKTL